MRLGQFVKELFIDPYEWLHSVIVDPETKKVNLSSSGLVKILGELSYTAIEISDHEKVDEDKFRVREIFKVELAERIFQLSREKKLDGSVTNQLLDLLAKEDYRRLLSSIEEILAKSKIRAPFFISEVKGIVVGAGNLFKVLKEELSAPFKSLFTYHVQEMKQLKVAAAQAQPYSPLPSTRSESPSGPSVRGEEPQGNASRDDMLAQIRHGAVLHKVVVEPSKKTDSEQAKVDLTQILSKAMLGRRTQSGLDDDENMSNEDESSWVDEGMYQENEVAGGGKTHSDILDAIKSQKSSSPPLPPQPLNQPNSSPDVPPPLPPRPPKKDSDKEVPPPLPPRDQDKPRSIKSRIASFESQEKSDGHRSTRR